MVPPWPRARMVKAVLMPSNPRLLWMRAKRLAPQPGGA